MSERRRYEDGSPAEERVASHERVGELIRSVRVTAPAGVHRRVQQMAAPRARSNRGLLHARLRPTLAAMAVAAVAGAAVALLSGGATTHSLNLREASALTLRPATMAAPQESGTHLNVAVEGVPFPYWGSHGWHSSGARTDTVARRHITTVFYSGPHGARIGYAIVGGMPAPAAGGGIVKWRQHVPYRLVNENGVRAVVWERSGRLCVLSGHGVSDATLLWLASDDHPQPQST
jgi:hypothetical protein